MQPLTVLRQVRHAGGELRTLAVEIEGRECVLEELMEGLVIGVLGPERREGGGEEEKGEDADENGEAGSDEEARSPANPDTDGESESASTESEEKEKAKRVHALTLKAQALAEYLREELRGFKMPPELH